MYKLKWFYFKCRKVNRVRAETCFHCREHQVVGSCSVDTRLSSLQRAAVTTDTCVCRHNVVIFSRTFLSYYLHFLSHEISSPNIVVEWLAFLSRRKASCSNHSPRSGRPNWASPLLRSVSAGKGGRSPSTLLQNILTTCRLGCRTEMYCASCEVRTEFIYVM
jgi:hypothetical protein